MSYRQVIAGLSIPASEKVLLEKQFEKINADLTALRTEIVDLVTKMDADFVNVTNASTDYVATIVPAAITFTA